MLAEVGIKAIIQPGGSIRDDETIAAANEHGITLWSSLACVISATN